MVFAYHGSIETIGILNRLMCMVPKGPTLVDEGELVGEALSWRDATLRDRMDTVHPSSIPLINPMPVKRGARLGHHVVDMNTDCVSSIGLDERTRRLAVDENHGLLKSIWGGAAMGDVEGVFTHGCFSSYFKIAL